MKHTNYEVRYATNPQDFKAYDTQKIRQDFLIKNLFEDNKINFCLLYTSPSPRDRTRSRMPSSA